MTIMCIRDLGGDAGDFNIYPDTCVPKDDTQRVSVTIPGVGIEIEYPVTNTSLDVYTNLPNNNRKEVATFKYYGGSVPDLSYTDWDNRYEQSETGYVCFVHAGSFVESFKVTQAKMDSSLRYILTISVNSDEYDDYHVIEYLRAYSPYPIYWDVTHNP